VGEMLREYTRELQRATQLLNAGAPQVVMMCERGHVTVLHRAVPELGGFAHAVQRGGVKLVELPDWAVSTLKHMADMLEQLGSAISGIPEMADVEIEGVRLTPQLRRLLAAAALQRPELVKLLDEMEARRREHAAKLAEMLAQHVRLPPCPHVDPATKQRCGAPARPVVLHNAHLELLGLQHVASAAAAMARAAAIARQTGFDRLMRLQGVGTSSLAFLFWAAAINRRPDRVGPLLSYVGLAPVYVCPECRAGYKGAVRVCPKCGRPALPTLPTKAVAAALGGVPLRQTLWAQSRAWVMGRALLLQALAGRAPAVMAALARFGSIHYARYMDCWHRAGGDARRARELGCISHKLLFLASREPERFAEYAVYVAVANATLEVVKIYIIAAACARGYLERLRPVEPYGSHRAFWPPVLFWRLRNDPPEDYIRWFGADVEAFERERRALNERGAKLLSAYSEARKRKGAEAWEAWVEVFAAAQAEPRLART